jgi:hypothetical protein
MEQSFAVGQLCLHIISEAEELLIVTAIAAAKEVNALDVITV